VGLRRREPPITNLSIIDFCLFLFKQNIPKESQIMIKEIVIITFIVRILYSLDGNLR